jgi:xylitol oxidase
MDKRTFLKLLSAAASTPLLPPFLARAAGEKLKNWAGNVEYATTELHSATSFDDAQDFVRKHVRMKVLGTRHCFNHIADSKFEFLSLRSMDKVLSLDADARTVTIPANMAYGQLAPYLHEHGFALHNLASLPHISVAGACATATHGSGEKNGNLATQVAAFEMITASGEIVKLSRKDNEDIFLGAVVGLGALGVITKMTLNLQPTFQMKQYVYLDLPLSQLQEHFDAIEASGYSVSLFTDWQNKRVNEVWIKSSVEPEVAFKPTPEFFGAKAATRNMHPIAALSAENCTEQMGVAGPWYERLPHFKMGFTPSAGDELQAEYFVPRRNAVDAILAIEKIRDQVTPHLFITEIRTIAADDFWMSPCNQQDSVTIHFTLKPDWPAVRNLLPVVERELAPFGARPHWGKLFTMDPAKLRTTYAKLPDFLALAKKYDPTGKFRNDFLNTNVFGS